ncbi:hypothetical protein CBA19CS11_36425 [Caballeronia novacaledonica]|uniref:hypothetical protein n=1 Tax=Caballeronia novacaledonica TaxID=1544861 RepID=UPI001EE168F4|nr:hypothetical protein [Caballeronia novacaledonica]GJH14445.1 hypothetical protein CBA19CS11_36425 [Caballeronia novacaledonica]
MTVVISEMGLNLEESPIEPKHACYRPPSWPPPADWVVSVDEYGNPKSRWGDPYWDFSAWVGRTLRFDFSGGWHNRSAPKLSPKNQHVMRMLATWILWGPMGARSWSNLKKHFDLLRRIAVLCDSEGVVASNLIRHPTLVGRLAALYPNDEEAKTVVRVLDRLLRSDSMIGFILLDEAGIFVLSSATKKPKSRKADNHFDEYAGEQTAYIPPRIWVYQVRRLRECLDDFLEHRQQIEDCFRFCVEAYRHNFGSLELAFLHEGDRSRFRPFAKQPENSGKLTGRQFYGPFELIAQRFGIYEVLAKWVLPPQRGTIELTSLTAYLTLVQTAGATYIANFTFQRKEEVAAFRADCLIWEEDPVLGRIPILCGEAIKTDPDSDARWPTSPSVEVAVDAMTAVAKLRIRCAAHNPTVNCSKYDQDNPFLFHNAFEPWASVPREWKAYSTRPKLQSYWYLLQRYPRLFDLDVLKVTEEDLAIARKFTPNLSKDGRFDVGKTWPLAYHELRRTGAINMFASGLLSESSIQVILKHLTLLQTRYYGRNFGRLRFNEEFENQVVSARYEVMGRQMQALVGENYVSPYGEDRKDEIVVSLIGTKDFQALVKAAKNGEVPFRETRLGGCARRGHCDYGGIESIARCSGGDGEKPCRDALYDKRKRRVVQRQLESTEIQVRKVSPDSPRARALKAEIQGFENYLNATKK